MASPHYDIRYKRSVEKELRELPGSYRDKIAGKILALANDPRPAGSVKLRGSSDLYRIRHADYRIVYQVRDGKLTILVIKIGHRRDVYKDY